MQFPFITYGIMIETAVYRQNTNIPKSVYMSASGASELKEFAHFHILKLLFPTIFFGYFRYIVSETYTFSSLKLYTYKINAVSFYYGMAL